MKSVVAAPASPLCYVGGAVAGEFLADKLYDPLIRPKYEPTVDFVFEPEEGCPLLNFTCAVGRLDRTFRFGGS